MTPRRPDENRRTRFDVKAALAGEADSLRRELSFLGSLSISDIPFPANPPVDLEIIEMYWNDYLIDPIRRLAKSAAREDEAGVSDATRELFLQLQDTNGTLTEEQALSIVRYITQQLDVHFPTEDDNDPDGIVGDNAAIHPETPDDSSPPDAGTPPPDGPPIPPATPDVPGPVGPESRFDVLTNENARFFLEWASGYAGGHFFEIRRVGEDGTPNWGPIDLLKPTYEGEEKQKILFDFFRLLLKRVDELMDASDIAGGQEGFATKSKKLRIRGKWKLEESFFQSNPNRVISQTNPINVEQWAGVLPDGLKSLLFQAEELMKATVGISNQAKDIIALLPESEGKGAAKDDKLIGALRSGGFNYAVERVAQLITGSLIESKEPQDGHEGYPNTQIHRFLGEVIQEAMFVFDRMYRGLSPSEWGTLFPHTFSQDGADHPYNAAYQHIASSVADRINRDPELAELLGFIDDPIQAHQSLDLLLKWGMQSAFDLVWAYIQAIKYDSKCTKSEFAEGANAATYHQRKPDGIPAKTEYDQGTSTKKKTPRVTDKARYYFSPLEFVYLPTLVDRDNLAIGDTEAAMRDYFEVYLPQKYGPKYQSSEEYIQTVGLIPESLMFLPNGTKNYAALAREFVILQVQQDSTPFAAQPPSGEAAEKWQPDKMFLRRNPALNQQLRPVEEGGSQHLSLSLPMYDILFRYRLPLLDDQAHLPLVQFHAAPTAQKISSDYGDSLGYEMALFMSTAKTDEISLLKPNSRDLIEWGVNARRIGGLSADKQSLLQSALGSMPRALSTRALRLAYRQRQRDLGNQIFDDARVAIEPVPATIVDAFDRFGIATLDDSMFNYYRRAMMGGESSKRVVPHYEDGRLSEIAYINRPSENRRPQIYDTEYRNVFVPWDFDPLYASRRAFEWIKVLEATENARDPDTKFQRQRAEFALQLEEEFFTVIDLWISQFMYPSLDEDFKGNTPEDHVVSALQLETEVSRTITHKDDVFARLPEDVACDVAILKQYVVHRAGVFLRGNNRPSSASDIEAFLRDLRPAGLPKDPNQIDTWGFSPEEIEGMLLSLYSFNGISSGPRAAGAALDTLRLMSRGKVGRFARTRDQIEHLRKTRADAGLLSGLYKGFKPSTTDKK